MRIGVHEGLKRIVAVDLINPLENALVAGSQELACFVPCPAGEDKAHRIVLDPQPPDLIHFFLGRGPVELGSVKDVSFIDREVGFDLQQGQRVFESLACSLHVTRIDFEDGIQITALHGIVKFVSVGVELLNIRCHEVVAIAVHIGDKSIEDLRRDLIIDTNLSVVGSLKERSHQAADLCMSIRLLEGFRIFGGSVC